MNKFFAASNSSLGFKSYYNDCFANLDKLYIIKGGPGTGKSGLMRKVAQSACKKGYFVENFYCSSDQSSLDGIILLKNNKSIGFIDGTSPHSFDIRIAGAVDNIIDLGRFWQEDMLVAKREEIISLSKSKSLEYTSVYKYLCSCGNLAAVIRLYMGECIENDRICALASKLTSNIPTKKEGSESVRLIDSIGMRGRVRFDSFEKMSDKLYVIGDMFGAGEVLLQKIRDNLRAKNRNIIVSYNPICPDRLDGIVDKDFGCAFILSDERAAKDNTKSYIKHVNMKRFVSGDKLAEVKNDIKYARALYKKAIDGAQKAFEKIEKYHFALENIYGAAMDFSGVDRLTEDYINKI